MITLCLEHNSGAIFKMKNTVTSAFAKGINVLIGPIIKHLDEKFNVGMAFILT